MQFSSLWTRCQSFVYFYSLLYLRWLWSQNTHACLSKLSWLFNFCVGDLPHWPRLVLSSQFSFLSLLSVVNIACTTTADSVSFHVCFPGCSCFSFKSYVWTEVCPCVWTYMGAHVCVCYQRTASPWTMWIPGVKLRSSGCKHLYLLSCLTSLFLCF